MIGIMPVAAFKTEQPLRKSATAVFAWLLGATIRLQMGRRRFMGHHPGREAIGVGLRLRSLQVLERLFAGLPGLGRDRLHELVVGAVHLVHHMGAAQDAI